MKGRSIYSSAETHFPVACQKRCAQPNFPQPTSCQGRPFGVVFPTRLAFLRFSSSLFSCAFPAMQTTRPELVLSHNPRRQH